MIFVSDYDGDPDEYLAAFGLGIETGMRWSFGSYEGFPGPRPTPPFIDYVSQGSTPPLLRYAAYPDTTVRDIDTALTVVADVEALKSLVNSRGPDAEGDEGPVRAAYRRLLRRLTVAPEPDVPSWWAGIWRALRHKPTVAGLAVAVPLDPDRRVEAEAAIRSLASEERSPFADVLGVHFVRAAVIEAPVRRSRWRRRAGQRPEPAPYLLLCAWVDGRTEQAVSQLVKALVVPTGSGCPADDLWGHCVGYPGAGSPEHLARWVLAHRLPFSLFLDSHAGSSAEEVLAALRLRDQVTRALTAHEGRPPSEVALAVARLAEP